MGIFDIGPNEEDEENEELTEITEDILDLYQDMDGKSLEELKKSHCGYERIYEKILRNLENYYNQGLLSQGTPSFLTELIQEIEDPSMVFPSTTITRVQSGLRKIARKLKIELPEKKQGSTEEKLNLPHITVNANQFQSNEINISNEVKIEVEQAINEFNKEVSKQNPDPNKLKRLLDIIKKGAGYGAIKVIEALLKKIFGNF